VPRLPSQGDDAIDRDVSYLMKIKRRVSLDDKRSEADRDRLKKLLNEMVTLLLNGKQETPSVPTKTKKTA